MGLLSLQAKMIQLTFCSNSSKTPSLFSPVLLFKQTCFSSSLNLSVFLPSLANLSNQPEKLPSANGKLPLESLQHIFSPKLERKLPSLSSMENPSLNFRVFSPPSSSSQTSQKLSPRSLQKANPPKKHLPLSQCSCPLSTAFFLPFPSPPVQLLSLYPK